jgi:hypothetical protein
MRIIGPGIRAGSTLGLVGSHVDLAPTWLGLAGLATPANMDGRSLVAALGVENQTSLAAALHTVEEEKRAVGGEGIGLLPVGGAYVEYHGLGPTGASTPPWFRQQDALNNTYRALRVIDRRADGLGNVLYAEFGTFGFGTIQQHEYFEMDTDPWQMHNQYAGLTARERGEWANRLEGLFHCTGAACRMEAEVGVAHRETPVP